MNIHIRLKDGSYQPLETTSEQEKIEFVKELLEFIDSHDLKQEFDKTYEVRGNE